MARQRSTFIASQTVGRLLRQLKRDYPEDTAPRHPEDIFRLHAARKRSRVYRAGWPDFVVEDAGKLYAVEVKARKSDALRPSQVAMFAVMERMGVQVFIWIPQSPNTLRPWRRWPIQRADGTVQLPGPKRG